VNVSTSWTPYLTQIDIDNFVSGSTYYANVTVIDSAGNKTMYAPVTIQTAIFIEDT
jgi:hypothetical protein